MSTTGGKELRVHLLVNMAGKIYKLSLLFEPNWYSVLFIPGVTNLITYSFFYRGNNEKESESHRVK